MRKLLLITIFGSLLFGSVAAAAETTLHADCRLVLEEERQQRDAVALELDLARSELVAAEEVYGLLDRLWKSDATERLRYLNGKHQRDRASIGVERLGYLLEQQEALIEQYRLICDASGSKAPTEEKRSAIDEAWRRYRLSECEVHASSVALAEVDLAYRLEVLASFQDLREHDVATRQDIVYSERDVEMARKQLAQSKRLVDACRAELGGEK